MSETDINSVAFQRAFMWFDESLKLKLEKYLDPNSKDDSKAQPDLPNLSSSTLGQIVARYSMNEDELFVLLLALAPAICPQVLDPLFIRNQLYNRPYTEFGGIEGKQHKGFLPTGETAVFLLSGKNLDLRLDALRILGPDHFLRKKNIIILDEAPASEPALSGRLQVSQEYLQLFLTGKIYTPEFSSEFPAKLLSSKRNWKDLVLSHETMSQVSNISRWLENRDMVLNQWKLSDILAPGFRTLFHGPPGTGKTMTATMLGKRHSMNVYRIDLAMLSSKYIGETEKNLAKVFDLAENKNWILFFDEADSLFGKRSATKDAQDRYANQEVSYLLQRIEEFSGMIILATNLKANIDEAFMRRFQSVIYFPMPDADQRLELWKNTLLPTGILSNEVDLSIIAKKFEISGGSINNVVLYAALQASKRSKPIIMEKDLVNGIKQELAKQGKASL